VERGDTFSVNACRVRCRDAIRSSASRLTGVCSPYSTRWLVRTSIRDRYEAAIQRATTTVTPRITRVTAWPTRAGSYSSPIIMCTRLCSG
jgi:hypothetical protein